jgi:hypothetical protein
VKTFLFGAACGALSALFPKPAGIVALCIVGAGLLFLIIFLSFAAYIASGEKDND